MANPPTLLLAIQELVRQYHASGVDKQDAAALLKVDADGSTSAGTVSEELKFFRCVSGAKYSGLRSTAPRSRKHTTCHDLCATARCSHSCAASLSG